MITQWIHKIEEEKKKSFPELRWQFDSWLMWVCLNWDAKTNSNLLFLAEGAKQNIYSSKSQLNKSMVWKYLNCIFGWLDSFFRHAMVNTTACHTVQAIISSSCVHTFLNTWTDAQDTQRCKLVSCEKSVRKSIHAFQFAGINVMRHSNSLAHSCTRPIKRSASLFRCVWEQKYH